MLIEPGKATALLATQEFFTRPLSQYETVAAPFVRSINFVCVLHANSLFSLLAVHNPQSILTLTFGSFCASLNFEHVLAKSLRKGISSEIEFWWATAEKIKPWPWPELEVHFNEQTRVENVEIKVCIVKQAVDQNIKPLQRCTNKGVEKSNFVESGYHDSYFRTM